jgi:hypothetical protein
MFENIAVEFGRSIAYVMQTPFFWQAMATVTIVAMIIGTMVYNGDLDKLWRGMLAIMTYGLLILFTTGTRIYSLTRFTFTDAPKGQTFAGISTIFLVTIFYLIGLFLGYAAHKLARKR